MKMKAEALAAMLCDIAQRVRDGDSFEGSLSYSCMEPDLEPGEFEVSGSYRIGNTDGQGGMRILSLLTGTIPPFETSEAPAAPAEVTLESIHALAQEVRDEQVAFGHGLRDLKRLLSRVPGPSRLGEDDGAAPEPRGA